MRFAVRPTGIIAPVRLLTVVGADGWLDPME
jgi:hypothetical protein